MTRYLVDTDMQTLSDQLSLISRKLDAVQLLPAITSAPSGGVGITVVGITVANTSSVNDLRTLYLELRPAFNTLVAALKVP